ncbi:MULTISPECIES: acyltransferase family protein [Pseudomonas]|uniref:acyltransferase family protein n=1 Tax=Pseudomonas TaxID=286 RepID=UPI0002A155E6|nr:acetyltransferase [Pseudomonas putida HB3267]MCE0755286.1 acyltransferase [Pseudomonas asiatica]PLP90969.1 acyltransferase [Pseudomonas sp. FFUP_PS_41]MCE0946317.1 acyltransferase [Pseudomonas asiatica]MCE0955904.1 acyltransferase [Pseudomonas asiatica]
MRLDVQGLRAVAVLAVLAYHMNSTWLPAGFVGVDVFFVISGFIITALLTEPGQKIHLAAFYLNRIKRIVPAYAVMLALVSVVSSMLFLTADFEFFHQSLKSAAIFASNLYFADFGSYFAPRAEELPLLHTWSLAIEMQFYLFFPLLLLCLPRSWRLPGLSLLAAILFVWSSKKVLAGGQGSEYFLLLARVPEFLVGGVVALGLRNREIPAPVSALFGLLGLGLLAASFVLIDKTQFPGLWSLAPCIGTALVIAARRGPINNLLSIPGLVWVGGISYSLYLWHWPVLALIRYYIGQYELSGQWLPVALVASFALAWLSYRFVEQPARRLVGVRRLAPSFALGVVGIALVALLSARYNPLMVGPVPVEQARYAAPELICHGQQVGECKRGLAGAVPSILVIGDSHAAQLNYFFDQAGTEQGVAYRVLTASSCVPIPGFDVERLPDYAQQACRSQIIAVKQALVTMDKVIIAGMWQYQMPSPAFVKALQAFLDDATTAHKQVVILGQVPMFRSDVQRVRRFRELGLPATLAFNDEWRVANQQVEMLAAGRAGVHFVDFSNSGFFADAPYEHGELIYQDTHHLNEIGARRYGHFAGGQLQRLFDQTQSSVSLKQ